MRMSNIVETANQAGQFNTLVDAVRRAGLQETLQGPGPFTVFAPTDEAFQKIPQDTLDKLLQDTTRLQKVLKNHVVPRKMMASEVQQAETVSTVEGKEVRITTEGGPKIEDAKIVQTDIQADNGVIHGIDKVLMPR
jgi:uncharacterized surface protein with fasciclin (FAS1) repeats